MATTFDFNWDSRQLEAELLKLSGEDGIKDVTEQTLVQLAQEIKEFCKSRMAVSKDNSKSGRKGNRPKGHARDNIPVSKLKSVKGKDFSYIVVGWEKADNSPYYYESFQEFGTTKMPPRPVFSIAKNIYSRKLDELYKKNLEEKLKRCIGG